MSELFTTFLVSWILLLIPTIAILSLVMFRSFRKSLIFIPLLFFLPATCALTHVLGICHPYALFGGFGLSLLWFISSVFVYFCIQKGLTSPTQSRWLDLVLFIVASIYPLSSLMLITYYALEP